MIIPIRGRKYIVSEPTIPPDYKPNKGWSVPVIYDGNFIVSDEANLLSDLNQFRFVFPSGVTWWSRPKYIKDVLSMETIKTVEDIEQYLLSLVK